MFTSKINCMSQSRLLNKKTILASLLLIPISMFWFGTKDVSHSVTTDIDETIYEVDHPFTTQATNLLKASSTTDKLESRLNKYDITYALDEVLLSEGLAIESDMTINHAGVNIPMTTYDPETKIGYLLIDYDRLGAGLSDKTLGKAKNIKQCKIDFLNFIDQGVELYFDNEEKFLDDVFGKVDEELDAQTYEEQQWTFFQKYQEQLKNGVDSNTAIMTYTESMTKINNLPRMYIYDSILRDWQFYGSRKRSKSDLVKSYGQEIRAQLSSFSTYGDKREYLEIVLPEYKKKLVVEYLSTKDTKSLYDEWKLSAADVIEEPDRFFAFTGMIDNIRIYDPTSELSKRLNAQIIEVVIENDSKEWWNRSRAIFDLFNVNQDPGLFSKTSYKNLLADILTEINYTKWPNRYEEIKNHGDKENISLNELNSLGRLAIKNGIYVAPISILDDLMIYDMEEDKYLAELAHLREKISQSKNKTKRKELQKELLELSQYRAAEYPKIRAKAKAKSIAKLKESMCSYIDWARYQASIWKGDENA